VQTSHAASKRPEDCDDSRRKGAPKTSEGGSPSISGCCAGCGILARHPLSKRAVWDVRQAANHARFACRVPLCNLGKARRATSSGRDVIAAFPLHDADQFIQVIVELRVGKLLYLSATSIILSDSISAWDSYRQATSFLAKDLGSACNGSQKKEIPGGLRSPASRLTPHPKSALKWRG